MKRSKAALLLALILTLTLCGCGLKLPAPSKPALSAGGTDGSYSFGSGELTDKVERIEIEWSSGKLELAQQEGSSIRIDERSQTELTEKQKVHWRVDGTTLHIWYSDPKTVDILDFNFGVSKDLTVTLPESLRLDAMEIGVASSEVRGIVNADKLTVDSASGSIELTTDASELEVDTASGDVRIRHSGELKKADFDTASGAVEGVLGNVSELSAGSASGDLRFSMLSAEKVEVDTASGKVLLSCGNTPAALDVETASGNVELTLPGDADFRMEVDTASGKFRSEIPLAMQDDEYLAGSGRGEIEISTASGDITLKSGS